MFKRAKRWPRQKYRNQILGQPLKQKISLNPSVVDQSGAHCSALYLCLRPKKSSNDAQFSSSHFQAPPRSTSSTRSAQSWAPRAKAIGRRVSHWSMRWASAFPPFSRPIFRRWVKMSSPCFVPILARLFHPYALHQEMNVLRNILYPRFNMTIHNFTQLWPHVKLSWD